MMSAEVSGAAAGRANLRVGDHECETVKDECFSVLRRVFGIPDDFLDGALDFKRLGGGGGKGGDLMVRTTDGRFFVKALNGGDATSLLRDDFLKDYIDRVSTGTSLLCKVCAVFKHPQHGQFLAMANCLPTHVQQWSGIYDLKGSADDKVMIEDGERMPEVHKRCWNFSWMLCEATGCNKGIPLGRRRYVAGKKHAYRTPIYVTKEQKTEILTAVKADVALFEHFGYMDYSMIVGIHRPAPGQAAAELEAAAGAGAVHSKGYACQHGGDTTVGRCRLNSA